MCCILVAAAVGQDDSAELMQLQDQVVKLRQQLEGKNASIKQVIDKLRHMLDAFNMWDSHQRHLLQHAVQYAAAGPGTT
jgi:hypothetical protein